MEWITDLIGVGVSSATGGLFGALGAIAGAVAKHYQMKEQHKMKLELLEWDIKMFDKQMESKKLETEMEIAITSSEGAWSGLQQSIRSDAALARNAPSWVNGVKSLFRPILTTGLGVAAMLTMWWIWSGVQTADPNVMVLFTEAEIKDLVRYMVYSLFFAFTTSVVWWYGDRAFAPPGFKNR